MRKVISFNDRGFVGKQWKALEIAPLFWQRATEVIPDVKYNFKRRWKLSLENLKLQKTYGKIQFLSKCLEHWPFKLNYITYLIEYTLYVNVGNKNVLLYARFRTKFKIRLQID